MLPYVTSPKSIGTRDNQAARCSGAGWNSVEHERPSADAFLESLRAILPDATILLLEDNLGDTSHFDQVLTMINGRFDVDDSADRESSDNAATADLNRKMRALASTAVFLPTCCADSFG